MPRFVILEHDYPELHWDFMLETGAALRTWRLARAPEKEEEISATPIGDHRPFYLDYEGPVSGGRGAVKRWDVGEYQPEVMEAERVVVRLSGGRLNGTVVLERVADVWRFRLFQENSL